MRTEEKQDALILEKIAVIRTGFSEKFGIPRQSGLAGTKGTIVFEPSYRDPSALRGIDEYEYLWLLWGFSEVEPKGFRPTVRPPRLGGNERKGVFATRSPFRPNPVGLSLVKLVCVAGTKNDGLVLQVEGADMLDGSPVYDIKPYLPGIEARPDAKAGFADRTAGWKLKVSMPEEIIRKLSGEDKTVLCELLSQDPRPGYQDDPERVYGMYYGAFHVRFRVVDGVLYVLTIEEDR